MLLLFYFLFFILVKGNAIANTSHTYHFLMTSTENIKLNQQTLIKSIFKWKTATV